MALFWNRNSKENTKGEYDIFLPKFNTELNYNKGKEGEWVSCKDTVFGDLAERFPVNNFTQLTDDEFSIPSPWAKYILFEMSLLKPFNDEVHERVLSEWRGLIALLASSKQINIPVEIEVVDLGMEDGIETDFFKVLVETMPRNALFGEDSDSRQAGLICIRDEYAKKHLIGMVSKSTIVCTPYVIDAYASTLLAKRAPWCFRMGRFIDPLLICREQDVFTGLYLWIDTVFNSVQNEAKSNTSLDFKSGRTDFNKILKKYLDDVEKKLKQTNGNIVIASRKNRNIVTNSVFDIVDLYYKNNLSAKNSDFEVMVDGNPTKLLLVSEKLGNYSYTSEKALDMFLFESVRYIDWNPSIESGIDKIAGVSVPEGYYIMNAKDIFLPNLYLLPFSDYFNTEKSLISTIDYNGKPYSVIWPVNEKIFEYIPADLIKRSLSIEINELSITVSVKLMLRGPEFLKPRKDTNVIQEIFSRTYRNSSFGTDGAQDEIILSLRDLNNITIWPYRKFIKDNRNLWSRYTILSVADKFETRAERYQLEPVYSKDTEIIRNITYDKINSAYDYGISIATNLPIYMKVKVLDNPDSGYQTLNAGVIFMKDVPNTDCAGNATVDLAVDFGTSSTTVYMKENDRAPSFVIFGKRYDVDHSRSGDGVLVKEKETQDINDDIYSILIDEDKFGAINDKYFIPEYYLNKDIYLSVFERLSSSTEKDEKDDYLINNTFELGHIFFLSKRDLKDLRANNFSRDLKWGGNQNEEAKAYLLQIMLQSVFRVMCKGFNCINWRFSYPTALGRQKIDGFESRITKNIDAIKLAVSCEMKLVKYASESEASAIFYQKANVFKVPGPNDVFVCIDIGGGSTDISIWKDDFHQCGNKAQSSIAFASRVMFLNEMMRCREVFTRLFSDDFLNEINKQKDIFNFYTEIESSLFQNFNLLHEKFTSYTEEVHKSLFVKKLSIGFSGIFYYVYLLLVNLNESKKLDEFHNIVFFLSGNGSRCVEWLPKKVVTAISKQMKYQLKQKFGFDGNVSIEYNPEALKTEAGKGLLYMKPNQSQRAFSADSEEKDINEVVISGESVFLDYNSGNTSEYSWDTDLKSLNENDEGLKKLLHELKSIRIDPECQKIWDFITFCNEVLKNAEIKDRISIKDSKLKDIFSEAEKNIKESIVDKNRFEPVFISILKALIEKIN